MEPYSQPRHLVPEPVLADAPETVASGAILRPAAAADIDALVELEMAFLDEDRVSRRNWRDLIRRGTNIQVVEASGEVVGAICLLFRRDSGICRIYSIAVSERARGCGYGRLLLNEGIRQAILRGCDRMRLEVRIDNEPATRLYELAGFDKIGIKPDYYDDGTDARHMQLNLPGSGRTRA